MADGAITPRRIAEISVPARLACQSAEKRRAWPSSKISSPVVTLELCDEIVRLNLVNQSLMRAIYTAFKVAGEARAEWDEAPSTMKAGKLLIALIDPSLNYRADITAMHAAVAEAKASAS